MSFISYSQNFEDVMLFRALKDVGRGFYIDVGANDPVVDSVTKAFYDRGWRGVNIDPSKKAFDALCALRPRDINLNIAVSSQNGSLTFYDVSVSGWSTIDKEVADKHIKNGVAVSQREVDTKRLADICKEYAPSEIHFLKIDVEGAEELAIDGMDFKIFRPWIVVVEATAPNSSEETHGAWEPKLLESGYEFSYFDGLNRFYVAAERGYLKSFFLTPPNVFDDYVLFEIYDLRERLEHEKTEAKLAAMEANARIHEARTGEHLANVSAHEAHTSAALAHASANEAHEMLRAVFASKWWKMTAPLRFIAKLLNAKSSGEIREIFRSALLKIATHPKIVGAAKKLLNRFPYLSSKAKSVYREINPAASANAMESVCIKEGEAIALSEKEREVMSKLCRLTGIKKGVACE